MSTSNFSIDQSDLEKLNDKDKTELRQFFANEEHRARIQAQTHELTAICWKKCVASSSTSGSSTLGSGFFSGGSSSGSGALDSSEKSCLANCVDRFMDANLATMRHLASMRQQ